MGNNHLDVYKKAYQNTFEYDLDNRLVLSWYPERIIKKAAGESLLELGLGHGYSSIAFAQKYKRHLVIEGSQDIIDEFNRKNSHKVNIVKAYFEDFSSDEKFDIIVMGFILEHVENADLILAKYKQFLSPHGTIFIAAPNSEALNKRIGFEAGIITDMSALSEGDKALGHKRLFTVDSLKKLVKSNGYTVKETEGIFLKPVTTKQICQLNLSENVLQAMLKVGINYPELCVGILMRIEADKI